MASRSKFKEKVRKEEQQDHVRRKRAQKRRRAIRQGTRPYRIRRAKWLKRHGYVNERGEPSYAAYLRSPHWKEVRREYFQTHESRCRVCRATEKYLVLHHLSYERMGRERSDDLVPLCEWCHALVHDNRVHGRGWSERAVRYLRDAAERGELEKVERAAGIIRPDQRRVRAPAPVTVTYADGRQEVRAASSFGRKRSPLRTL